MKQISIIKEIEENYNLNNIVSAQVPIWQYIRNLIYSQNIHREKYSNRLKKIYCLLQNHNWGNYKVSKNYKYLLFTDSNEEIINNKKRIDKTSQSLIELATDDLMVVVNPGRKRHGPSLE